MGLDKRLWDFCLVLRVPGGNEWKRFHSMNVGLQLAAGDGHPHPMQEEKRKTRESTESEFLFCGVHRMQSEREAKQREFQRAPEPLMEKRNLSPLILCHAEQQDQPHRQLKRKCS